MIDCSIFCGGKANGALFSLCCADHMMADEFSAELADGVAFVAGHDDDGRPVVVRAHTPLDLAPTG
jgi:hypothetical protein